MALLHSQCACGTTYQADGSKACIDILDRLSSRGPPETAAVTRAGRRTGASGGTTGTAGASVSKGAVSLSAVAAVGGAVAVAAAAASEGVQWALRPAPPPDP